MQALTTDLDSVVKALPVFSFEDEARMLLELGALGKGWCLRETMAGELISVLFGPCAGVDRVALDPLPYPFAKALVGLVSMRREAFMETYLSTRDVPAVGRYSGPSPRAGRHGRAKGNAYWRVTVR
ncbi:MAG: hypothetical protein L0G70_00310 [Rubrobacter sp.]|nr:hypothetical protein [Rubrobacter sp.]